MAAISQVKIDRSTGRWIYTVDDYDCESGKVLLVAFRDADSAMRSRSFMAEGNPKAAVTGAHVEVVEGWPD